MVPDAPLGDRMTRSGLIANGLAGLALVTVLVVAEQDRRSSAWRTHQAGYLARIDAEGPTAAKLARQGETVRPHEINLRALETVDRCTTCHLGHEPGAPSFDAPPFQGHPDDLSALHEQHPLERFGCTTCHGGQGRALDQEDAHDRRAGTGGWSAFTPPRDRCARCHPQGGERSPRGGRGATIYLEQGCLGCHQPGRRGPAIGPDLASIALRGEDYLRRVILHPDSVYPETIMPPMNFVFDEESEDLAALFGFLRSFEPWPRQTRRQPRSFDPAQCTSCHRVGEESAPAIGRRHRCPYLLSEADWLSCARCHEADVPPLVGEATPASMDGADAADGGPADDAAAPARAATDAGPDEIADGADGGSSEAGIPRFFERPVRPVPGRPDLDDPSGACPFLTDAFTSCGVCHREGER